MSQTFRIILVLTLVMCSVFTIQQTTRTNFLVENCSASGTNLTWDMLNQTIFELQIWITNELGSIRNNISYIGTRLDEINTTMSNISAIIAEDVRMRVEEIITELNESTIIGRLEEIQETLGYGPGENTVYADLSAILVGLVDANNSYILRDSEGTSSFYHIATNQQALGDNQQTILNSVNGNNQSFSDIKESIRGNKIAIGKISGEGIISLVGTIAALFLVVWFLFLKNYLAEKNSFYKDTEVTPEMLEERIRNDIENEGKIDIHSRREPSRLSLSPFKKGEPICYKDGVTYDPVQNPTCGMCHYQKECEAERLEQDAIRESREAQERERELNAMRKTTISARPLGEW